MPMHVNNRLTASAGFPAHQRGAVLIVSLILLLVMTIIGVFAMRGTTMEERMAGNMRDRSMAFEAGESALRDAERWLDDQARELNFSTADGADAHLFHYTDFDNNDRPRRPWEMEGDPWVTADSAIDGVSRPPEYIIEQRPFSLDREVEDLSADGPPPQASDQLFRIWVQAWGGSESDQPFVYLESQYRPQ